MLVLFKDSNGMFCELDFVVCEINIELLVFY